MRTSHRIFAIASVLMTGCAQSADSPPGDDSASNLGGNEPGRTGSGGRTNRDDGTAGSSTQGGAGRGGARSTGGSSGNRDTGSSNGAGSTAGGTGTSVASDGSGAIACVPGVPSTTQIPRMTSRAYDTVVRDLLGIDTLASAGNQPPSSLLAPDSEGSLTDIAWNGYLSAAEKIAAEVMAGASKSKFIGCDPSTDSCLTTTIKTFGRKAFRRPLADTEVTSFMRLNQLTPKGSPAEVAEAILYAFLASPSFIMLPELAKDKEGGSIKLSSYEVATRLSFLLWGTVPDDALSAAADTGQLTTKEQIATQAQRMAKSDRASAVVTNFHHYYAGIEPGSHWVNNTEHDGNKYSAFTAGSYAAAMAEMDAFFQEVVLKGGTFADLFLSKVAFVTKDTAALYGLKPGSYGAQPKRVELDADQRPGFLTRVGFLSTFSKYDVTSPILRGAFISGRVLGVNPGNPDPAATRMSPPPGNYTTQRQAIEALTKNEPCYSCHARNINPSGFVLERYNSVGGWQDTDPMGGSIDGSADVRLNTAQTKTMASPIDLMTAIANLPEAKRRYAEQWVAFATGRVPNPNDACTAQQLTDNLAQDGYPILNMLTDYTQADSFRLRTVGN